MRINCVYVNGTANDSAQNNFMRVDATLLHLNCAKGGES